MISEAEFGQQTMSASKQAIPENTKFDGNSAVKTSGEQNSFAANADSSLAKPGTSD
jgi:hypothetical protein